MEYKNTLITGITNFLVLTILKYRTIVMHMR